MISQANLITRKSQLFAICFILLISIIFFYPVIFEGRTFYAFDNLLQYMPWSTFNSHTEPHNPLISDPVNLFYLTSHYLKSSLQEGVLPFWKSSNFCGVLYTPPYHPLYYLLFIFQPLSTHDLFLWFHLLGIGIFMWLFLREIGLGDLAATVGAVSWMFNGYLMVWFEFENVPMLAFPLVGTLFFLERWFKTHSMLSFLWLVVFIALSICASLAHILIYQFIFLAFYTIYRFLTAEDQQSHQLNTKFRYMLLGTGLAFLIASIVSLSFFTAHLSVYQASQRDPIPFSELYKLTGQLPAKYLITLIFPDFFGSPVLDMTFTPSVHGHQPYNNYNELCIYPGILVLFLAVACIPYCTRRKYVCFFVATAVLTLLMAMGSIIYYPFARFIPGLNLSTPTRVLYLFGFSMSTLAAFGTDIIMKESGPRRYAVVSLWTLLTLIVAIAAIAVQTDSGIHWAAGSAFGDRLTELLPRLKEHYSLFYPVILKPLFMVLLSLNIVVAILFAGKRLHKHLLGTLAISLLTYDLISFGLFYNTTSPMDLKYPTTPAIRFLQKDSTKFRVVTVGNFLHNALAVYNLEDIGGYGSFYPRRYGEFLHLTQHGYTPGSLPDKFNRWIFFSRLDSPLLDFLNTKYALIPPHARINLPAWRLVYDGEIAIYQNLNVLPRVFFVNKYDLVDTPEKAHQAIAQFTNEDFGEKVLLESPPPFDFAVPESQTPLESRIEILAYKENEITLSVSAPSDGFVVISGSYHPSWTARVDDEGTEILRANYIGRAIPVKAGHRTIELTCRPRPVIIGLAITAASWILLFGLILILSSKKILGRTSTDVAGGDSDTNAAI